MFEEYRAFKNIACFKSTKYTRDDQNDVEPYIFGMAKNRKCVIISQHNPSLSRCPFSIDVPVCLSVQNRSLLPGLTSTLQQQMWRPHCIENSYHETSYDKELNEYEV